MPTSQIMLCVQWRSWELYRVTFTSKDHRIVTGKRLWMWEGEHGCDREGRRKSDGDKIFRYQIFRKRTFLKKDHRYSELKELKNI